MDFPLVHCLLLVFPALLSCVELLRPLFAFGGLTGPPMKSISKGVAVVSGKEARTTNQASKAAQHREIRQLRDGIDSWGCLLELQLYARC